MTPIINTFGDTFMWRLRPALRKHIEIKDHLTVRRGSVDALLHRLNHTNVKRRLTWSQSSALLMIGIYDIMNYKRKRETVGHFVQNLTKKLSLVINFLGEYHRNVVILTCLPVLKMQEQRSHWLLLKAYNKFMRKISAEECGGCDMLRHYEEGNTNRLNVSKRHPNPESQRFVSTGRKWTTPCSPEAFYVSLSARPLLSGPISGARGIGLVHGRTRMPEYFTWVPHHLHTTSSSKQPSGLSRNYNNRDRVDRNFFHSRAQQCGRSPLRKFPPVAQVDNSRVCIVDVYPKFLSQGGRQTCNSELYEKATSGAEGHVLWNGMGIQRILSDIVSVVVNAQKLPLSNEESKIEKEEICGVRTIISNKLGHTQLQDSGCQCSGINYFTGSNLVDRNAGIHLPYEQGEKAYSCKSKMDGVPKSMYNNKSTCYISEDLKQKLSQIRVTEYSSYGEELVQSNKLRSIEKELLTVGTYNVLSQELLEKHSHLYTAHDNRSLVWNVRKEILLEELSLMDADVLCLQEVDSQIVGSFYNKYFNERGYEGVFKRRTHDKFDGCAIYFRRDKFNLVDSSSIEFYKEAVRILDRDNIGIVLKLSLKDRPGVEMIVATTHLLYNQKRGDIKLAQTQVMLAEIERLAYRGVDPTSGEPLYLPIVFTGDMNYPPVSGVYRFVTTSRLEYEGTSSRWLLPFQEGYIMKKTLLPAELGITDSCQYASVLESRSGTPKLQFESGALDHPLNLASVYSHVKKDYPEATTNSDSNWVTVDYIFYSQSSSSGKEAKSSRSEGQLKLVSKLSLPNSAEAEADLKTIPNLGCASDHLPLLATFHLTGS